MKRSKSKKKVSFKSRLFYLTILLTILGIVAVADASAPVAIRVYNDKYFLFKQQITWAVIGVVSFFVASMTPLKYIKKYSVFVFGISILTLILVALPGFGSRFLGARRWLIIGPISIQPSEIVKLGLALYIARLSESKDDLFAYLIPVLLVSFLVMLQPDLGTTIIIVVVGAVQIFLAGIPFVYMIIFGGLGVLAGFLLIILSDYRRERLTTFLDQTQDPLGSGYHIRQVLLGLGSGGLLGVGLGQSKQKFLFLPEAATDSIFAVIAEEVGFIGGVFIIFLFFLYIYYGFKILVSADDTFSKILAGGIIAWIGGQVLLNIASMVAITPLTGIPLPFFSYGGSSLVMVLTASGILVNIGKENERSKR
ncbi:putative lipid II flippase FtsW [Candidatus Woesebacteria bacterium]|nr:putative lipid II flippase FtsW [Candidatus Woesebacteria bacterium]